MLCGGMNGLCNWLDHVYVDNYQDLHIIVVHARIDPTQNTDKHNQPIEAVNY